MKTKLPLVFGAVLLLALGGFGFAKIVSSPHKKVSRASGSSPVPSAQAAGSSNPQALATNSSKAKGGKETRYHKNCVGHVVYSRLAGEPVSKQFIRAQPVFQSEWGKGCWFLHPGMRCRVGWNAGYSVPSGDAYLRFQEWAEGAKHVTSEVELGPIPGNNSVNNAGVAFAIPNANSVAFRIVLENDKRVPVAISDSYIYPVDCVPPSG